MMRRLSAAELLDVWEQGLTQPPIERALTLLAAACPEMSVETLAEISLGQRDGLLLRLREKTFGSQFVSLASCHGCGERLELAFDANDLRVEAPQESPGELGVSVAGYVVRFRLPNSRDLIAAGDGEDLTATRRLLLKRCLLQAQSNGAEAIGEELPAEVMDAIAGCMAEADPQADVRLVLVCPRCDRRWQAAFDIESFFWREIDAWAGRTLREVHLLASRYGWREGDILAMSARRRQWYLNLVSG
jgi:hypothetical protein